MTKRMRAFESYLTEAMLVDIRSGQRLAIAKEKSRLIFRKLGKGFVHYLCINQSHGRLRLFLGFADFADSTIHFWLKR